MYYIQRARFFSRPVQKGIDKILSYAYMGSAEFEFGALGESLNRIRPQLEDYMYSRFTLNEKSISVFHHKGFMPDELLTYLTDLSQGNLGRLKEYSDFDNYIYPDEKYGYRGNTDFWWDICNDIMFWKQDNIFEKNFKELIKGN